MNRSEIYELESLPSWVWGLLDALDKYEDEHPPLYRTTLDDEYVKTPCFGSVAELVVPSEVMAAASLLRSQRVTA